MRLIDRKDKLNFLANLDLDIFKILSLLNATIALLKTLTSFNLIKKTFIEG